jgi:hypothetical protein
LPSWRNAAGLPLTVTFSIVSSTASSSTVLAPAAIMAARNVAVPLTVCLAGSTSSASAMCWMSTTRSGA